MIIDAHNHVWTWENLPDAYYDSFAGVISMEDIIEHLIGKEIYEKDDVAVDMRQLARLKSKLIELRK